MAGFLSRSWDHCSAGGFDRQNGGPIGLASDNHKGYDVEINDILQARLGKPGWLKLPGGQEFLVVDGTPPSAAVLQDAVVEKRAGIQIRRLKPVDADLQWLEPVTSTLKSLLVTLPEGKIDPTRISECTELRMLSFSAWPTRILDFSQLRKLESLSVIWTRDKYANLEALSNLKSLGIDLPPEDLSFLKAMVWLEDLSFTAARRIRSVPEVGNPSVIKTLAMHGSPEFSLGRLSTFPNLRILDLDHIKKISDSANLANCIHLEELLLEECGPE